MTPWQQHLTTADKMDKSGQVFEAGRQKSKSLHHFELPKCKAWPYTYHNQCSTSINCAGRQITVLQRNYIGLSRRQFQWVWVNLIYYSDLNILQA